MKETQQPLMQLLHHKELQSRYEAGPGHCKLNLLFF